MKPKLWDTTKADKAFSLFIRNRDKVCFFGCGNPGKQNSHFWGRATNSTRYDPENCDAACGGCHMKNEGNKQGLYRDLKMRQLGKAGYDRLEKRYRTIMKRSEAVAQCQAMLEGSVVQ